VGVAFLWPLVPDTPWGSLAIALLSAVPLFAYLLWYCRRSGGTLAGTFGLRLPPGGLPVLARATLALVAVSTVGDVLLELVGARLGLESHWTDGFQERLVLGTWGQVAVDVLDSCLLAPVLEEILFRGLLYGTLRLRLGPWPATAVSAGFFALAHGYGVIGFASVAMSGVLWAAAYERTRSLLPGILAHAANNVQATAIVLATLRF
jgi:membrane protease YdiL (CAAX protease family)